MQLDLKRREPNSQGQCFFVMLDFGMEWGRVHGRNGYIHRNTMKMDGNGMAHSHLYGEQRKRIMIGIES